MSKFYIMSPFHPRDSSVVTISAELWEPSFREDAVLERREALLCCIEGIRQLMKPEEFGEIVREILKPPQEE
jgi:hypothetical protein